MAAFGLRHPPQDVGLPRLEPSCDQPVDGSGQDLAAPCREQAIADLGRRCAHVDHVRSRLLGALALTAVMAQKLQIDFRPADFETGAGAWLLQAMRDEMRELYEGLDMDSDDMPRAGAAELGPPTGGLVVGWAGEDAVCVGGVKRLDELACEIKRMYVAPAWRGRGVARRLLRELEELARQLGYETARLDTGPRQASARGLYESEGYAEIGNFNANPVASFWGEKPLYAGPRGS
jgi:GNAT superfamily N-acetyltransferase